MIILSLKELFVARRRERYIGTAAAGERGGVREDDPHAALSCGM
jgi:hypothetical protein